MTLDELLEDARRHLHRVDAPTLRHLIAADPDLVVLDTRTPTDRAAYGCIPTSIHTPRTVLEWRVAIDAPLRRPEITSTDQVLVVVCNEGFSSSLGARSLQLLGFHRATDLIGGVAAWLSAGFEVEPPRDDELGIRGDDIPGASGPTHSARSPGSRSHHAPVPSPT